MKCPYRKIVKYTESDDPCVEHEADTVTEEFADCYQDDCPKYDNKRFDCKGL